VHIFHTLDDDWDELQRRKSTKVPKTTSILLMLYC
jgi:hypothetical protein